MQRDEWLTCSKNAFWQGSEGKKCIIKIAILAVSTAGYACDSVSVAYMEESVALIIAYIAPFRSISRFIWDSREVKTYTNAVSPISSK